MRSIHAAFSLRRYSRVLKLARHTLNFGVLICLFLSGTTHSAYAQSSPDFRVSISGTRPSMAPDSMMGGYLTWATPSDDVHMAHLDSTGKTLSFVGFAGTATSQDPRVAVRGRGSVVVWDNREPNIITLNRLFSTVDTVGGGGGVLAPDYLSKLSQVFAYAHIRKYSGNPILSYGAIPDWDWDGVIDPCVIYDTAAGIYKMWYLGWNDKDKRGIGYATSPDGINWTKYSGNPVLTNGPVGSYDQYIWEARVMKDGTIYRMYYQAVGPDGRHYNTAYATSTDGINWVKHGLVLTTGAGKWDSLYCGARSIVKYDGLYYLFYEGKGLDTNWDMGLAVSRDGSTFTKISVEAPVLTSTPGLWDCQDLVMSVIRMDSLWVCVYSTRETTSMLGVAFSKDAVHWYKCSANPLFNLLGAAGQWDGFVTNEAITDIIKINPLEYYIYYRGTSNQYGHFRIGLLQLSFDSVNSSIRGAVLQDGNAVGNGITFDSSYGYVSDPDVAYLSDTSLVVVWDGNGLPTGSQSGIYGQITSTSGKPSGADFLVTDHCEAGTQNYLPRVLCRPQDNFFTAIWEDNSSGQYDLYGRKFAMNGSPLGPSFLISDDTTITGIGSYSVAQDTSGAFVVTWMADKEGGAQPEMRWFDNQDNPTTPVVRIYPLSSSFDPEDGVDVSIDRQGRFVVVWTESSQWDSGTQIYGQRFNSAKRELGTKFKVSADTVNSSHEVFPQVVLRGGNILVVWQEGAGGIDGRVLSFDGIPAGTLPQSNLPVAFVLFQNYPNPFNPSTTIKYQISARGLVTLRIYDVLGRQVSTLVDAKQTAGIHQAIFDGGKFSSGVYLCRLTTSAGSKTMKMVLMK